MPRKRITTSLVAVLSLAFLLSACALGSTSGPTTAADAVNREAASITDCGGGLGSTSSYAVQVRNLSSTWIQLKDTQIDCYDWWHTANPTRLNVQLSPGTSSAVETFDFRNIDQSVGQIRPWDFTVALDPYNGAGPLATGAPTARPVIKFASQQCNTGAGMTVCLGASLCADDPAGMKVETDVNLAYRRAGSQIPLKMTTICSISDRSAYIVFSDK